VQLEWAVQLIREKVEDLFLQQLKLIVLEMEQAMVAMAESDYQ
jgi:hypothetical protein